MKLAITSLSLSFLASSALAGRAGNGAGCLSQQAAETLVGRYAAVLGQVDSDIGTPVETAYGITLPSYSEYSDSANIQLGIPVRLLHELERRYRN